MAELKRYAVTVNGNRTVMKLTEEAAKQYDDATPVDETGGKSRTVANKSRSSQTKKGGDSGGSDHAG